MHEREPADAIRKIAVVRANGIGDYCFAVPALHALRAAYPQAEIVLLGKRWHRDFLSGRPGPVNRTVIIPPYKGVSTDSVAEENQNDIENFFQEMRNEHFDIALQLHGGGRYSNPFTQRLNARITAGMRSPDAAPLDRSIPYIYFQPEVLRYLEVVSLVGASPTALEPSIPITAADETEIDRIGIARDIPLAVIHPGASDPRRRWPPENFAAVAKALASAGAKIVIVGTDTEKALIQMIERLAGPVVNLCNRLTLGGLAALLARSQLIVANDSGPLHLGGAVGIATVGIYWCGNMINGGPVTRLRHRPLISWRLDCAICNRNTLFDNCDHHASFVADVKVDEVIAAAMELWKERCSNRSIAA